MKRKNCAIGKCRSFYYISLGYFVWVRTNDWRKQCKRVSEESESVGDMINRTSVEGGGSWQSTCVWTSEVHIESCKAANLRQIPYAIVNECVHLIVWFNMLSITGGNPTHTQCMLACTQYTHCRNVFNWSSIVGEHNKTETKKIRMDKRMPQKICCFNATAIKENWRAIRLSALAATTILLCALYIRMLLYPSSPITSPF